MVEGTRRNSRVIDDDAVDVVVSTDIEETDNSSSVSISSISSMSSIGLEDVVVHTDSSRHEDDDDVLRHIPSSIHRKLRDAEAVHDDMASTRRTEGQRRWLGGFLLSVVAVVVVFAAVQQPSLGNNLKGNSNSSNSNSNVDVDALRHRRVVVTEGADGSGLGYNCQDGCDLSLSSSSKQQRRPVCGVDGRTYRSECFAICQQIDIQHKGRCKPQDDEDEDEEEDTATFVVNQRSFDNAPNEVDNDDDDDDDDDEESYTYAESGTIPLHTMKRFSHEGYTFIGKREKKRFVHANDQEDDEGTREEGDELFNIRTNNNIRTRKRRKNKSPKNKKNRDRTNKKRTVVVRTVRVTDDGDEYVSEPIRIQEPTANDDEADDNDDGGRRKLVSKSLDMGHHQDDEDFQATTLLERGLSMVGNDERTRIAPATSYPYHLVGRFTPPGGANGGGSCTGTVISRTSIVTAAHCIYDLAAQTYVNRVEFYPAQYDLSDPSGTSPYGVWQVDYSSMYQQYKDQGTWFTDYDIAVVTFKPDALGRYIGDVTGYAGIRNTLPTSPFLQASFIAGYPSDKGSNGEMWLSSDGCYGTYTSTDPSQPYAVSPYRIYHQCDTWAGSSGSALMDASGYVHGVHWGGRLPTSEYNVGLLLRDLHYDMIKAWSGRGSNPDEPRLPGSPPPPPPPPPAPAPAPAPAPVPAPVPASAQDETNLPATYSIFVKYDNSPQETTWSIVDVVTGQKVAGWGKIQVKKALKQKKGKGRKAPGKKRANRRTKRRDARRLKKKKKKRNGTQPLTYDGVADLLPGRTYRLTLNDSGGNGFKGGYVQIKGFKGSALIFNQKFGGKFKKEKVVTFRTPL